MSFEWQSVALGTVPARMRPMTEQERAAENLKVIRALMERATVYRAISWPTALFGGVLALILSSLLFFREKIAVTGGEDAPTMMSEEAWVLCWLVAMLVTAVFNSVLIARKSSRDGSVFFSPGLKMALRALVPPMLVGGLLGIGHAFSTSGTAAGAAAVWTLCYGLALLATISIAPRSIRWLGWSFLVLGVASYAYVWSDGAHPLPLIGPVDHMESPMMEANLIMGAGFGGLHLVYGLIVMFLGRRGQEALAASDD